MAAMSEVKRELLSIIDGGSHDPGGDARTMMKYFCEVLSARGLDLLCAELEKELTERQGHVPTAQKHFRALEVLEEAVKVLKARKKRP
jgi:hypothetical protein